MHRFENLRVWQQARELTNEIYAISAEFPETERFGLSSQIRRASSSIMMNIAEGSGRSSARDFSRFLDIAAGSANEVHSAAIIAFDQAFIDEHQKSSILTKTDGIRNMLYRFQEKLKSNTSVQEEMGSYPSEAPNS